MMAAAGRVFLAAGHAIGGGARANGLVENPYNARVGLLTVAELRAAGADAWLVPLTREPYPADVLMKTRWIGERCSPQDLALDLHLDIGCRGCAVFTSAEPHDLAVADLLAAELALATGLRCRGGLPDSEADAGTLHFVRNTACLAMLVELCSMNTSDALFAHRPGSVSRFARGLARGCLEALGHSSRQVAKHARDGP
jgi:N-acetylmuramoyl-L-alanine amidase